MGIFINYRRDDNGAGYSRNLAEDLQEVFGEHMVFRDVQGIAPGADFEQRLRQTLGQSKVLLAVIGKHWLQRDAEGRRRIDEADDWVRVEIETALQRKGTLVIPVLVAGARPLTSADALPESLQPFLRRQAIELSDRHWERDVGELVEVLVQHGLKPLRRKPHSAAGSSSGKARWWIAAAAAALVALVAVDEMVGDPDDGTEPAPMNFVPTPSQVADAPAPAEPEPTPQAVARIAPSPLTGRWFGQDGSYYDIGEAGGQVQVIEYNAFGVQTAQASGTRNGSSIDFVFQSINGPGHGRMQVSDDGRSITSTIQWQLTGMTASGLLVRGP